MFQLCNYIVYLMIISSNQLNLANLSGGCSSRDGHAQTSSDDESDTDDETATRDLNSWRSAVSNATSAAQLSVYVTQLVRCIAWEKSIMKVVCGCFYFTLWYTLCLQKSLPFYFRDNYPNCIPI